MTAEVMCVARLSELLLHDTSHLDETQGYDPAGLAQNPKPENTNKTQNPPTQGRVPKKHTKKPTKMVTFGAFFVFLLVFLFFMGGGGVPAWGILCPLFEIFSYFWVAGVLGSVPGLRDRKLQGLWDLDFQRKHYGAGV